MSAPPNCRTVIACLSTPPYYVDVDSWLQLAKRMLSIWNIKLTEETLDTTSQEKEGRELLDLHCGDVPLDTCLAVAWYQMSSGRFEVICYLS